MFSVPSALLQVSQQQGFASPGGHISKKSHIPSGGGIGKVAASCHRATLPCTPSQIVTICPRDNAHQCPLGGHIKGIKPGGVWGTFCSIFLSEPAMCGRQTPHRRQNHPLGYQQAPVVPLCGEDMGHRPAQSMSSPPEGRRWVVLCPGCTASPSVLTARSTLRWRQSAARISSVLINSFAFVLRCCFRRCQSLCGG